MTLFGICEIMGHRTRAGVLSDASIGGATMLRIEHPTLKDHTGEAPLTEYYSPAAIFAIRPCSEAEAIAASQWWRAPEVATLRLSPVFDEFVEEPDDDLDDDDNFDRVNASYGAGQEPF